MRVRVVNRRSADEGVVASMTSARGDNIFHQISDIAAPRAISPRLEERPTAQILRPSVFSAHRKERIRKDSPAQLRGVACAGAGAMVITRGGAKPIEALTQGDMLLTRDNGFQPLLWQKSIRKASATPMTVEIEMDAMGSGIPGSAVHVSGRQGVLLTCPEVQEKFGTAEILVRAGDLLHLDGVREVQADLGGVVLMMTRHELINVNGLWIDSFVPDAESRKNLTDEDSANIARLVPGLNDLPLERSYPSARQVLNRSFARQLMRCSDTKA